MQQKMSVAARRQLIVYIIEQAIMCCVMVGGFLGFMWCMGKLLG